MKIHFFSAETEQAELAKKALIQKYNDVDIHEADVVVALGGDGSMLRALHESVDHHKPVFGMNRGSIGFLLNPYSEDNLLTRLEKAQTVKINPLHMRVWTISGEEYDKLAINEVSLLRETRQAAKLAVTIDGVVRLEELICDGIIVATSAGSTAYNLSVGGPIIPLNSSLLALTPISAFRPRRWRGALLHQTSSIAFDVRDPKNRPVSAVADSEEIRDVERVEVRCDESLSLSLLFDPEMNLDERIIKEQFLP